MSTLFQKFYSKSPEVFDTAQVSVYYRKQEKQKNGRAGGVKMSNKQIVTP